MAYSCPQDHGLHLNILQYYIEILRDDLSPCSPGEPGQVHVTTLTNYSMPLIRYRIGDMAVPAQSVQCTCGRGLPLIERVEGRETSMFETRAGEKISAIYFIHFFGVVLNRGMIRKFQVIQRDYDDIAINVVTADTDALESCKGELEQSIRDVMGPACRIEWRPVDDIPALANGKYLYTVNQMQHITDKP
jgi:phenylacetate-CoA ligase